jgi:hypothetical protein
VATIACNWTINIDSVLPVAVRVGAAQHENTPPSSAAAPVTLEQATEANEFNSRAGNAAAVGNPNRTNANAGPSHALLRLLRLPPPPFATFLMSKSPTACLDTPAPNTAVASSKAAAAKCPSNTDPSNAHVARQAGLRGGFRRMFRNKRKAAFSVGFEKCASHNKFHIITMVSKLLALALVAVSTGTGSHHNSACPTVSLDRASLSTIGVETSA